MNVHLDQDHVDPGILLPGVQIDLHSPLWLDTNGNIRAKGCQDRATQCLTKGDFLF
ncbi:hypothetical protein D3C76_1884610 [compost metagenome]